VVSNPYAEYVFHDRMTTLSITDTWMTETKKIMIINWFWWYSNLKWWNQKLALFSYRILSMKGNYWVESTFQLILIVNLWLTDRIPVGTFKKIYTFGTKDKAYILIYTFTILGSISPWQLSKYFFKSYKKMKAENVWSHVYVLS